MKSPPFRYIKPDSIDSVFELLDCFGDDAKILAGGQSLIPSLNMRLSAPEVLIDISDLHELKQIKEVDGVLEVGALVRHCEVEKSSLIACYAPLLSMALPYVAHRAIRSRGTFGGSIAFADAASETPAMVSAHEAKLIVRSSSGERSIPAKDFFIGLYETALRPNEILIRAEFQKPDPDERFVFKEVFRRKGDYATVGLGVRAKFKNDLCLEACVVLFAIEDKPVICSDIADYLRNKVIDAHCINQVMNIAEEVIHPFADTYHDELTKIHLIKVLLKRALTEIAEGNQNA